MHGPVRVAQTAGVGNAKVTIAFDSWKDGNVASTQHEISVVAPHSSNLKLEAVSSRLKGELIHPNRTCTLAKIDFSPDGKHLLAGDYPGGVIALWDVASGKRLTTLDAGYGLHATLNYYAVSPDWRTVFTWREKRKYERVEQDGKRMTRWTFGGEVNAWNLEDGKLLRTYKRQPQSNVRVMELAPDGKTFYTRDELPGTYEGNIKEAVSLWEVESGSYRTLEELNNYGVFSPDGKTMAAGSREDRWHHLKLIDLATGRAKWSIPVTDKNSLVDAVNFSRDGRIIFGEVRIFDGPKKWDSWQSWMKWWDAAAGHEVASFPCDKNDVFMFSCLSPDGQTLAVVNWKGDSKKLFLYNVPQKRLERTVLLCEKTEDFRSSASTPAFSPDGKWLAVSTGRYPEKTNDHQLDPCDLPQPRILLIEAATGAIRETMIAPQGGGVSPCFSPDGRMLATGGHGRVLLWDMTKMPQ